MFKLTNVFSSILESTCLSVSLCVHVSVFCQRAGGGIKSHSDGSSLFLHPNSQPNLKSSPSALLVQPLRLESLNFSGINLFLF